MNSLRLKLDIVVWTAYNLVNLYLQWERKMNKVYTQKDIDQVRAEWAKCIVKFQDN
jgi:hypothetical protein